MNNWIVQRGRSQRSHTAFVQPREKKKKNIQNIHENHILERKTWMTMGTLFIRWSVAHTPFRWRRGKSTYHRHWHARTSSGAFRRFFSKYHEINAFDRAMKWQITNRQTLLFCCYAQFYRLTFRDSRFIDLFLPFFTIYLPCCDYNTAILDIFKRIEQWNGSRLVRH